MGCGQSHSDLASFVDRPIAIAEAYRPGSFVSNGHLPHVQIKDCTEVVVVDATTISPTTDNSSNNTNIGTIESIQLATVIDIPRNVRKEFVYTEDPVTYDRLLREYGYVINDCNVVFRGQNYDWTALSHSSYGFNSSASINCLSYLLTCDPPADVNLKDKLGYTAMHYAAMFNSDPKALKLLIDFGGDRKIQSNEGLERRNMKRGVTHTNRGYSRSNSTGTPLDLVKKHSLAKGSGSGVGGDINGDGRAIRFKAATKVLEEYYPSARERLAAQLECKLRVDAIFKEGRFRQAEIDLKFQPYWETLYPGLYAALESGDVNRFREVLPSGLSEDMKIFLISIALKRGHEGLVHCLCENLLFDSVISTSGSSDRLFHLYSAARNCSLADVCDLLLKHGLHINEGGLFDLISRLSVKTSQLPQPSVQ